MKRTVMESSIFSERFLRLPHSMLHKRTAEGDHRKLPETCLASQPILPYHPCLCRPTEYTSARTPPLLPAGQKTRPGRPRARTHCSAPFEDKAGPGGLLPGEIAGILNICDICAASLTTRRYGWRVV